MITLPQARNDERQRYTAEQASSRIASINAEIDRNIRQLSNLVLSDEDRRITEDLIFELMAERDLLRSVL